MSAAGRVVAPALEAEEFAGLMARLGPFEPPPRIAAPGSGGAATLAPR